jgi:hypothetical protein
MDSPTSKFQRALPYIVLPVSPQLAALYASRVPSPDSCSKCGSYLLNGNATIRVIRLSTTKKALRRTCHACGCMNDLPIEPDSISHALQPSAPQEPTITPEPLPPPQTKSRPKKKTGLQDMLSRSRQKQNEEQRNNEGQVGLAAFLSNL